MLYIADLNNGALRRAFINGQCRCPPGSLLIASAQSCYNPTRHSGMLIQCPGGQFALEGDIVCRDCSDALAYGLAASACTLWAAQKKRADAYAASGFSYAGVVAQPQPPGAIASDWYGKNPPPSFSWDDIFRIDSPVKYSLGAAEGRAPWGGEFIALTFDGLVWVIETAPQLQPRRILPGLWFPCSSAAVTLGVCWCSTAVAAFDNAGGKSPWHEARLATYRGMGRSLGSNLTAMAGPPWPPVASYPAPTEGVQVELWSRFMILGYESGCGRGPCFTVFHHLAGTQPQLPPDSSGFQHLVFDQPTPLLPTCAVGWPAHYECPAGYTWVAPNSSAIMRGMLHPSIGSLPSNIACLSCLPGTFSAKAGGYRCTPCMLGTYASAVGSTFCDECPSGTYADVYGASACASCGIGYWTYSGAQTTEACNPCPPGTGSCDDCVAGQYQSQSGQVRFCVVCLSLRGLTLVVPGALHRLPARLGCATPKRHIMQPLLAPDVPAARRQGILRKVPTRSVCIQRRHVVQRMPFGVGVQPRSGWHLRKGLRTQSLLGHAGLHEGRFRTDRLLREMPIDDPQRLFAMRHRGVGVLDHCARAVQLRRQCDHDMPRRLRLQRRA